MGSLSSFLQMACSVCWEKVPVPPDEPTRGLGWEVPAGLTEEMAPRAAGYRRGAWGK